MHAYDHRTLALLAYTGVYRFGTFVPHDHEAIHWVSVGELDAYDFAVGDLPIVRLLRQQ